MALQLGELRQALINAGASYDEASRAAEEVVSYQKVFGKRTDEHWWFPPLVLLAGLAIGAGLVLGPVYFLSERRGVPSPQRQQACDVAMQRLMTTDDLVELRRDAWLVDRLGCNVTRRVVPALVRQSGDRR
jgi:hypothetical protein